MGTSPARLKVNPIRGRRPVLQNCTIGELAVDPAYQRSIDNGPSQALIRRIARDWDWTLCQPLVVAHRGGQGLYVVDGQHRLAAARLRGDIHDLPCVVADYGDATAEAASFVALNRQRRPLGALDLFKAALAGGDPEATAVMALIETAGLTLAPHGNFTAWRPGMVSNVGGILRCHKAHGPELTGRALAILARAFDGEVLRYGGRIFAGIHPVLADLCGAADDELIVLVLQGADQATWHREIAAIAADRGIPRNQAAAAAIRAAYDEALGEEREEEEAEADELEDAA